MNLPPANQVLAFVWRPGDLTRAVVEMARQTSTTAIFDLSAIRPGQLAATLRDAGAIAVKISARDFMDPELELFLAESGVRHLWVEYHPGLLATPPEAFLARLGELSAKCVCVPVTGDLELLDLIASRDGVVPGVGLKGNEAAGFVGSETLNVLFSHLRQKLRRRHRKPDLILWGGIATAEAAAAYLSTGVQGIVFESLHWLTDLVGADHKTQNQLTKLRPDHTRVVGAPLGLSCRFFDKGNFTAVKEMEQYARTLSDQGVTAEQRRLFIQQVERKVAPALDCDLSRRPLVFLGPEAAFAHLFMERYGYATARAIQGFWKEVSGLLRQTKQVAGRFQQSAAARELGTTYPFIQGAMAWISDIPEFSLAVAQAGGLPTVALGVRTRRELEEDFSRLPEVMGTRPYAVNLIALAENPFLEDQLAWIAEVRPPFVAIAAGEPGYAVRLRRQGVEVIYITADLELLRLAMEGGVRWVVLEGNEAGGHVGTHSGLILAQMALELKRRQPELFEGSHLVLAGGIYDRETAFRAAMLGADAIQMGTAYLATREIVATGALSRLYQRMILEAGPGTTAISGESIGLRVRSLKTAKMEAILTLEKKYLAGKDDESSFRRELEMLSAKSLLIAARGQDGRTAALDEETCLKEGQFMSGAVAGMIDRVITVAELHQELAAGPLHLPKPKTAAKGTKPVRRSAKRSNGRERIAITGFAMVNSLGNTPAEVWENVLALKSGITEVPPSRWKHGDFYDPRPGIKDKTYCKVGAFQNITIHRKDLGIPPQDFRTMSNSTKLTLHLANQAVKDSGIVDADIPRERIGIIISQNAGESASTLGDLVIGVSAKRIVHSLRGLFPLTPEMELEAERHIKAGVMGVDDTTLLGRLNSTAGGFISNKFGFMGPCFSVSAACATSLVAIFNAIQLIRNGVIDAAIVGGGEENLFPAHFIEFSALGALAGVSGLKFPPQESSRPFDSTRDGFVLGEGGGMIVIERESVAKKRGAPIHAYITGAGASNNDRGMVESVAETQKIAIRAAFEDAGYGPEMVDLIECHATSTMQGDVEEVRALKNFYHNGRRIILTSFKSQIGHSLGASGISSLMRGIMALQSGICSPTLNYRRPDPEMDMERSGFHVLSQPDDWPRPPDRPRRLQVNAFGFGGANFVVQVEESLNGTGVVLVPQTSRALPQLEEKEELAHLSGISCFRTAIAGRRYRLGVVAANDQEAAAKVAALEPVQGSQLSDKYLRALAGQGVFVAPESEESPPLAFVFAGQGTFYPGMAQELYQTFPVVRQWMDRVASLADFDLLHLMFHSQEEDLQKTRWQQPALFAMEFAMVRLLLSLGLRPAALAGHSMGEITALCVAGVFSFQDGFRVINKRAQCMDKAAGLSVDPGAMIAVDVPLEVLNATLARYPNVHFTNYNSPLQIVLGGSTQEVHALKEELDRGGYWNALLRVSMAFHSPIMKVIRQEMQEFVSGIDMYAPLIPVISNTTMQPYPDDPEEIKKIIMAHLENPVHWQQNVETLWHDYGVRTFLEVGPKNTLSNLIADTIAKARVIHTSYPENEAFTFRAAAAQLFALGYLDPVLMAEFVAFPAAAATPALKPITGAPLPDRATAVIQREINTFILDTFGKYLRPAILEAIRREVDPNFTEELLGNLLGSSLPLGLAAPAPGSGSLIQAPTPPALPPSSAPAAVVEGDYLERVIHIIMEATGYERDEIEPQMDIRQDLAIRSSRLPVIMDLAERQFGITIKLEDFINVRTVQEIADRIADVVQRDGVQRETTSPEGPAPIMAAAQEAAPAETKPIKRLIFAEAPLGSVAVSPLSLPPDQEVAILSLNPGSPLAAAVASHLRKKLAARPLLLGEHDLTTAAGAASIKDRLAAASSLAGLVLVLDDQAKAALTTPEEVPGLLTGFFGALQELVRSPHRKFCLLLTQGIGEAEAAAIAAEGVLGMLLDAALEYESVLFRTVALDHDTDLEPALQEALNLGHHLTQIRFHGQVAHTLAARVQALTSSPEPEFQLPPDSVVVISGGAKGITPHLTYPLAPFQPRLILLGSRSLDPDVDYEDLLGAESHEEAVDEYLSHHRPELHGAEKEAEAARLRSGLEISATLKELARRGMSASFITCDVNDQASVTQVLKRVAQQYGKIDGVIHGAGILRDSFLEFMSADDFARVVEVKLLGAWHLYQAAREHGLRFLVMLSSITAVRGNVGQVNYCAGNRAMSGLPGLIAAQQPSLRSKVLMLPPIAGAGMADAPELHELMRLRGMEDSYLSVDELGAFFSQELFLGPAQDHWVMPIRALPTLKTARIDLSEPPASPALGGGVVAYQPEDLPMIQTIRQLDLAQGTLEAERTFSLDYDLWMSDHLPFKFLKHPLVSGVMAVETLLEAGHVLYPHLTPLGVRQVEYRDILECPPGVTRQARIACRRLPESRGPEVICEVAISSQDITATGRILNHWFTNYTGQVILGAPGQPLPDWPGFAITDAELDTKGLDKGAFLRFYQKHTNFQNRYRVLQGVDGAGDGSIRAPFIYNEQDDFAGLHGARYQYSPYLLEAFKHMVNVYHLLRDSCMIQIMIPFKVGEMRFSRRCRPGERLMMEGRLRTMDNESSVWDVRALDADGKIIMVVKSLVLRSFTP